MTRGCVFCFVFCLLGRRGVTLGKPDIKVETVNKETHSLEEEAANVSTATRMVKAMYSVSSRHPSESPEGCGEEAYGSTAFNVDNTQTKGDVAGHTHTHVHNEVQHLHKSPKQIHNAHLWENM